MLFICACQLRSQGWQSNSKRLPLSVMLRLLPSDLLATSIGVHGSSLTRCSWQLCSWKLPHQVYVAATSPGVCGGYLTSCSWWLPHQVYMVATSPVFSWQLPHQVFMVATLPGVQAGYLTRCSWQTKTIGEFERRFVKAIKGDSLGWTGVWSNITLCEIDLKGRWGKWCSRHF